MSPQNLWHFTETPKTDWEQTESDVLILEASLEAALSILRFDLQGDVKAEDKMFWFTDLIHHKWKDLRLGSLVGIYTIIKYNEVSLNCLMNCINEIFKALVNFEMQEEVFIICALEILIFIGPTDTTINQINILTSLLSEDSLMNV